MSKPKSETTCWIDLASLYLNVPSELLRPGNEASLWGYVSEQLWKTNIHDITVTGIYPDTQEAS